MGSCLKRLGLFVAVVAVVGAGSAWFATHVPRSPFDGEARPAPGPLERSEYVARLADCVACHTTERGKPFAGGLAMGTPLGAIYTTNITPDKQTGIGNYSLADFDNAVRRGVRADGARLYPAMPHPSYAKMTDDDIRALYDYFMNHVQPVSQSNRPADIAWPLNMRWPLAFWNAAFTEPGTYQAKMAGDDLWNRGAYLVQGPGHCGSCHTPRGVAIQEVALDERDPRYLSGALLDGWYAPSLRNDHNTGLGRWTEEDIVAYLKQGRNQHGVVFGSMMEAFNNSTQYMSDTDLKGIARYLKSLPGNRMRDGEPWQYQPVAAAAPRSAGQAIYASQCATCHGADGRGRAEWIAPLAGANSLLAPDPASAINITLNGAGRVVADGVTDAYRMPSLRSKLSDQQIAEVLTYVRATWGNRAAPVTEQAVKALRAHTDPASPDPIILQMR